MTTQPKRKRYGVEDYEHHIAGDILDRQAWKETAVIDGNDDRDWFDAHPDATEHRRMATDREVRALGCPATTEVVVKRLSANTYMRLYY
jgi:hypothetical protein